MRDTTPVKKRRKAKPKGPGCARSGSKAGPDVIRPDSEEPEPRETEAPAEDAMETEAPVKPEPVYEV